MARSLARALFVATVRFSFLPVWASDGPGIYSAEIFSILFQISGDGETNWIEGVQLLSVYLILGILFFYLPQPHLGAEAPH